MLLNCDLACNKIMDQQERVVFSVVPILLLILLLRRARRIRFLLTYNYLDLGTKESAAVSLNQEESAAVSLNRRRQRQTKKSVQASLETILKRIFMCTEWPRIK